jgi:succinate dehydrogenase flavin-adding protein (antitoxin of CptAB toxin-antitoxin module)
MQELDILLTRYLDQLQSGASSPELDIFDRLLALQDPELQRYLLAGEVPLDPELARLTQQIRQLPPS